MPSGYPFARSVRREFFDLVCQGTSVCQAERAVGVSFLTGSRWWREAGAMKLRVNSRGRGGLANPGDVRRIGGRGHRLSAAERITIMRGRDAGLSHADIGKQIGRDRTVVYREIRRNRNADGDYHALMAHGRAADRARRPKPFKLQDNPVCALIEAWMDDGWSPKLIADMLARDHPDDRQTRVSHETIYQSLYVQTRGSLRADLHKCLSTKRAARKPRGRYVSRGVYTGEEFSISDRPAEVEDRAVPGNWEGDLILGPKGASAIGTLVERSTRFTILLHLPTDHSAQAVAAAMIEAMSELPEHLRRSITWDRGSEMARWRDISVQLNAPVYFCNPHSPWQRGSNENTNRLLRFWFEKGSDLSGYTKADLKRIQDTLNRRPRPTLDLDTPAQRLAQLLKQAA
ncbi:integrase [Mycobacterium malmoense]|uniref:IS30 family transposase n=1 Tax=Mycobacterium malmoense TaxID=1780 RepID=UPI00080BF215|nr:IS30 family transposase [Mycobacterium malmoense]OCB36750.1 integrase [Mycobacterium malmoense]